MAELLKEQSRLLNAALLAPVSHLAFESGVSVIIPAYNSVDTIERTIESLARQSLDSDLFEVIIVFNGPDDGAQNLVGDVSSKYPNLNIRRYYSDRSGAGRARNLGLAMVRYSHVTFVDADDWVGEDFLSESFRLAEDNCLVVNPIIDVSSSGDLDRENVLNDRIQSYSGLKVEISEVPWVLGFNACKLVPTKLLNGMRYSEDLDSGEDLVFFAQLLALNNLNIIFLQQEDNFAYYRLLMDNSVSRQTPTFDFNVRQRVECIRALRQISPGPSNVKAKESLERAQASFVRKFLEDHPSDYDTLEWLLARINFPDFPWSWINAGRAEDLAISYCFLPYADTSAVVAAKAISARKKFVDVYSADMSSIRDRDASLGHLCGRWIDHSFELKGTPSFSDWKLLVDFGSRVAESVEERQRTTGNLYRTMYTRALWAGSHLAGAFVKIKQPSIVWTAEFSDPLRFGVDGSVRPGRLIANSESEMLIDVIRSRGYQDLVIETVFDLIEIITLLLADELVFTNSRQLEFMLSKYPSKFTADVAQKALVRRHPSPPQTAYIVTDVDPCFDSNRINLAYFGAFYRNRGLEDIFTALVNLPPNVKNRLLLHIFTSNATETKELVDSLGLSAYVRVEKYLPYLEFLNASTKADVLVVNDVVGNPNMDINPFLPSKYSDYFNSGTKIWGIVDPASTLSELEMDYFTESQNVPQVIKVLQRIVRDFDD